MLVALSMKRGVWKGNPYVGLGYYLVGICTLFSLMWLVYYIGRF